VGDFLDWALVVPGVGVDDWLVGSRENPANPVCTARVGGCCIAVGSCRDVDMVACLLRVGSP
jgi:hypothetical protein